MEVFFVVLGVIALLLIAIGAIQWFRGDNEVKRGEAFSKQHDFEQDKFSLEFKAKYGFSLSECWEASMDWKRAIGLFTKQANSMHDAYTITKTDNMLHGIGQVMNWEYRLYLVNEDYALIIPNADLAKFYRHRNNVCYKLLRKEGRDKKYHELLNSAKLEDIDQYILPLSKVAISLSYRNVLTKNPKTSKSMALDGAIYGFNVMVGEMIDRANEPDAFQTNCNAYRFVFAKDRNLPDMYKYAEGTAMYRSEEKAAFNELISALKK